MAVSTSLDPYQYYYYSSSLQALGLEPRPRQWKCPMLPLHHACNHSIRSRLTARATSAVGKVRVTDRVKVSRSQWWTVVRGVVTLFPE